MTSSRNNVPNSPNKPRPSLAVRINRAADDLNPFLMLVAVGLLLLNLTLYLGMAVSSPPGRLAASSRITRPDQIQPAQ